METAHQTPKLYWLHGLLVMVIVLAPLVCVWYCQLRHEVMAQMLAAAHPHDMSPMQMRHSNNSDAMRVPVDHAPHTNTQHVPLQEMQQTLLAVTEFVVTGCLLLLTLLLIGRVVEMIPSAPRWFVRVTVPPPKPYLA